MSLIIEHDKRRREILEQALTVFMSEGFENTSLKKIADKCGITRTTLYFYFRNKREIFDWSIKQLVMGVEVDLQCIRSNGDLDAVSKLKKLLEMIFRHLEENRRLLSVILSCVLHFTKSGINPNDRIRRLTIRLRHILATIVIEGVHRGELAPVKVRLANDFFYSLIEAAILQLVILERVSLDHLRAAAYMAIERFSQV